jgi:actin cytoskeleton-regulatory complex protein SLA1
MSTNYLAVLKALYDYETPQSDDELAIKEDQLLFLLEKVDDEQVYSQSDNY